VSESTKTEILYRVIDGIVYPAHNGVPLQHKRTGRIAAFREEARANGKLYYTCELPPTKQGSHYLVYAAEEWAVPEGVVV